MAKKKINECCFNYCIKILIILKLFLKISKALIKSKFMILFILSSVENFNIALFVEAFVIFALPGRGAVRCLLYTAAAA